jgi:hypothetical protein
MTARWPCDAIEYVDGTPQLAFPPRLVTGAESVITRCAIRIWTLRGVWPDDSLLGVPWLTYTLASTPSAVVQAVVRRQLAAVDGVRRVEEVVVSRPGTTLQVAARVLVDSDPVVEAVVGDLGVYAGTISGTWYQILGTGHRPIYPLGAS